MDRMRRTVAFWPLFIVCNPLTAQSVSTPVAVDTLLIAGLTDFRALTREEQASFLGVDLARLTAQVESWQAEDSSDGARVSANELAAFATDPGFATSGAFSTLVDRVNDGRTPALDLALEVRFRNALAEGGGAPLVRVAPSSDQPPTWLGQGAVTAGGDISPAIKLEVLRYRLGLGQDLEIPFFVLGGLPATHDTDPGDLASAILDEFGGTLNVAIGTDKLRLPAIGRLNSWDTASPFGVWFAGRVGAKLLDVNASDASASPSFVAAGFAFASLQVFFPVWNERDTNRDPNSRAGSLQAELTGALQWSNSEAYRSVLSAEERLEEEIFYLNGNLSLLITDVLYLKGAFTLATSEAGLDRSAEFSVSLMKKPS